jgi:hypothetical protein
VSIMRAISPDIGETPADDQEDQAAQPTHDQRWPECFPRTGSDDRQ